MPIVIEESQQAGFGPPSSVFVPKQPAMPPPPALVRPRAAKSSVAAVAMPKRVSTRPKAATATAGASAGPCLSFSDATAGLSESQPGKGGVANSRADSTSADSQLKAMIAALKHVDDDDLLSETQQGSDAD